MIRMGPKTNHKNISSKLFLEIHLSIYRCTEVIHPDVNNLHGLLLLDVLAVHRVVDLKLT